MISDRRRRCLSWMMECQVGNTIVILNITGGKCKPVVKSGDSNKKIIIVFGLYQRFSFWRCAKLAANVGKLSSNRASETQHRSLSNDSHNYMWVGVIERRWFDVFCICTKFLSKLHFSSNDFRFITLDITNLLSFK